MARNGASIEPPAIAARAIIRRFECNDHADGNEGSERSQGGDSYVWTMRAAPGPGEMMVSLPSPHLTWYLTLNSPTVTFRISPSRAGEPT